MRVPTYDNFQQVPSGQPERYAQAPGGPNAGQIAGEQLQGLGAAVQRAGDAQARIQAAMLEDANQTRVNDALNQYVRAQTEARVQAMTLKGRNALERPDGKSLPDEFTEKVRDAASSIEQGLGNDAQRKAFALHAGKMQEQFRAALAEHMVSQQAAYRQETQKATIQTAQNQGALLWSDKAALQQSAATIERTVADMARVQGWDGATREAALRDALSPMHAGVMQSMVQAGMATEAKAYYDANSASMSLQARAAMQDTLTRAAAAQVAQIKGAEIAAQFSYTQTSEAIKAIDALQLPPEQKAAIRAEVEHRHSVLQSDANANNALLVGKLDEMVQRGMSLAAIQSTPEFQQVRDKGTVLKLVRERTEHQVNLAAAMESRDYTRVQRLRAEQEYQGRVRMFAYSDPEVLASMSRPQVAALALEIGQENTGHLLAKYDNLQKPGAMHEAKIDNEQFDFYARQMGIDPAKKSKTDDDKAREQDLRNAIESVIAAEQADKKRVLTRGEKDAIMQREIARKVVVSSWLGMVSTPTPVIALTPEQMSNVVVPAGEQARIAAVLAAMNKRFPNDPRYAPTPENVRREYLRDQAPRGLQVPANAK